ncbi:MAG: hypothetical protein SD837_07005 [Candidatus Electrothrix scaldis]|nr:MAG: hypothetical protein SD837_07005 [Candidatus Electrothrix sp. GW3-3]
MKQKAIWGMSSILLSILPMVATADYINTTGPTGHYYQYAIFTTSNSEFKGGYDVDSYGDLIYINRGGQIDVYQVTLQDSDEDGVLEPDQHPQNIGGDETPNTGDDQIGPIEERKLTYLKTYSIPELGGQGASELYAVADRVYFIGRDKNIYQYVFATGTTSKVIDSNGFSPSQLGYDDVNHVWYASNESSRTVYSYDGTAWVPCFTYANLAGGHMDGLEVIPDCNGTPYVYISDMTSDYIGQWKYNPDTGSWKEENLFAYSDTNGSYVEGMGFGALKHIWVTGGSLYELGGGKLGDYFCGDFSVDDGGKCIPANSTDITYTASYKNKADIDIEDVLVSHAGGTWGGTSLSWNMGDIASGETGSTIATVPLSPPLVPNTKFSNQFTLTSTTPGVPEKTATVTTSVCDDPTPTALCKDIIVPLDANGSVVVSPTDANNGSSDVEGPVTLSLSRTNFTCSDIEAQHVVTLTATDSLGQEDSCISNVTVVDNLAPVPNVNPLPQVTGECSATVSSAPTAHDNCAGTVTGTTNAPLSYNEQGTFTVPWTFDDGRGNRSGQMQQVVVDDVTPPNVRTQNITVSLDENGNASTTADVIDNGSTDNCCIASRTIDKSSFTCADLGENTVILTVNDCNGNSSSATATVTVKDDTAPVIEANAPDTIIPPDAPISFTATVTDNCSATSPEITDYYCYGVKGNGKEHSKMQSCVVNFSGDTLTILDSGGVGDNITWTITATDPSGNTTSTEGKITVVNPGKTKK